MCAFRQIFLHVIIHAPEWFPVSCRSIGTNRHEPLPFSRTALQRRKNRLMVLLSYLPQLHMDQELVVKEIFVQPRGRVRIPPLASCILCNFTSCMFPAMRKTFLFFPTKKAQDWLVCQCHGLFPAPIVIFRFGISSGSLLRKLARYPKR